MQPDQAIQVRTKRSWRRLAVLGVAVMVLLGSCMGPSTLNDWQAKQKRERAMAMWQERCKKSGEFIHKTVEGVEGVYLVNVRTRYNHGERPEDQFALTDPYGHDGTGDEYILEFIHGYHHRGSDSMNRSPGAPPRVGFDYVEAIDPKDGRLYRFAGRLEEPWQYDKGYLKGYTRFVLDRVQIDRRTARYGVRFDDISTYEEREYWIAGSSLKVIDMATGELMGERVGYMVDQAQGSRAGGRSPWLLAAINACPGFNRNPNSTIRGESAAQASQTIDFVEKSLISSHRGD